MFAIIAVGLYATVAALALAAAIGAPGHARVGLQQSPAAHWYGVAAIIALLAIWRLVGGEGWVQANARDLIRAAGQYGTRRAVQGPVVIAMAIMAALALRACAKAHAPAREIRWSRVALAALVIYSAVRAVSYHPVDAVIYAGWGPFHVNHLIDLGLLGLIGWQAMAAIRRHRAIKYNSLHPKRERV